MGSSRGLLASLLTGGETVTPPLGLNTPILVYCSECGWFVKRDPTAVSCSIFGCQSRGGVNTPSTAYWYILLLLLLVEPVCDDAALSATSSSSVHARVSGRILSLNVNATEFAFGCPPPPPPPRPPPRSNQYIVQLNHPAVIVGTVWNI